MKKIAVTLAAVMVIFSAKAQITITNADMPQPCTADVVAYDTVTNVNIGVASALPQNWNFSALDSNYNKLAIYSPTAPYQQNAADFPGSNIYTWGPSIFFTSFYGGAPVDQTQWGYMYWKNDTNGFHIVGFRGNVGTTYGYQNVVEQPQELLMGAPATYGDVFPDSARWVVKFNKNTADYDTNYISCRKKVMTVDAFGTMTTPFGGPYNVVRVHEYIKDYDSVAAVMGSTTVYSLLLTSDTLNTYQFWTNGLGYPLAIVHADKNNNIIDVEYLKDTVPCYTITGNVYNTAGTSKVAKGTANLVYKDSWNHLFDWIETVNINSNGNFQFADIAYGNFLVQANPDPVDYPYLLPTYFGDTIYWQDATPIWMTQDTDLTIYCRNDSALFAQTQGIGSISGFVMMDTTNTVLNPPNSTAARGVKVILVQNPGGACRIQHTDEFGGFNFTNLADTSYRIVVDVPGVFMDSTYWISLSAKTMDYTNLGFIYDTSYIYIYYNTGITDHNINNLYDVTIYPNPFKDKATIHVSNPDGDNRVITFKVYDLLGRTVKEITSENEENIGITNEGLVKGMYIYELQVNRQLISTGKIVVN